MCRERKVNDVKVNDVAVLAWESLHCKFLEGLTLDDPNVSVVSGQTDGLPALYSSKENTVHICCLQVFGL